MSAVSTDLLTLLKKGNKEAFEVVYNKFYKLLVVLSSQYISDEDDAKNIVQNAFLKLWERKETINRNSNLKNYLFTLTKNESLNYLKHQKIIAKHNNYLHYKELLLNQNALQRITPDFMDVQELREKISNAIDKLPPQCKAVFKLSRIKELKNDEIAESMGISKKAVEANITRALKILKKELKEYLPLAIIAFL